MVSLKHAWVGFATLFLIALLILVAAMFWHHVTGTSVAHLLAIIPNIITLGC